MSAQGDNALRCRAYVAQTAPSPQIRSLLAFADKSSLETVWYNFVIIICKLTERESKVVDSQACLRIWLILP